MYKNSPRANKTLKWVAFGGLWYVGVHQHQLFQSICLQVKGASSFLFLLRRRRRRRPPKVSVRCISRATLVVVCICTRGCIFVYMCA